MLGVFAALSAASLPAQTERYLCHICPVGGPYDVGGTIYFDYYCEYNDVTSGVCHVIGPSSELISFPHGGHDFFDMCWEECHRVAEEDSGSKIVYMQQCQTYWVCGRRGRARLVSRSVWVPVQVPVSSKAAPSAANVPVRSKNFSPVPGTHLEADHIQRLRDEVGKVVGQAPTGRVQGGRRFHFQFVHTDGKTRRMLGQEITITSERGHRKTIYVARQLVPNPNLPGDVDPAAVSDVGPVRSERGVLQGRATLASGARVPVLMLIE